MMDKKVPVSQEDGVWGYLYLVVTLLIFSSSSSAYYWLNHYDPSVFDQCTVLCSSNMVGLLFCLIFYRQWLTWATLNSLSKMDWIWLLAGSMFYSVLAPYLFMSGLDTVTVADAAILSRMESINILVLAFLFLGHTVSRWALCNSLLTIIGIATTLVSPLFWRLSASFSSGNVYILASGWCYSISLLISMRTLKTIPVAVVAIFRVAVGTIMYHFLILFMGENVMELYNVRLWAFIGPYGIIWVFGGQVFWLLALSSVSSLTLSVGTTCLFVLTIFWSISVLGQIPTNAQWIGVGIIAASIASSIIEKIHTAKSAGAPEEVTVSPLLILQSTTSDAADPTALYSKLADDEEAEHFEGRDQRSVESSDSGIGGSLAFRENRSTSASVWSDTLRRFSSDRAVSYERFTSASFDSQGTGFRGF